MNFYKFIFGVIYVGYSHFKRVYENDNQIILKGLLMGFYNPKLYRFLFLIV